ncbi:Pentatricopeptide repeat superfamily protein [Rhynchospora pubera]|uniref:Pentatricopeptide repeat superfamily protein n=1 Tax=Rhynchospora pubera TaxID=906938 RepID=A0AAV8AR79_9POAL|nr:Pentatricopeptide repeat superfamily protein [Rhynchospora pubera]KAJ4752290.1 Pentatricopeptide repeat superfamily protein [Rhynchospora pubera]
MPPILPPISSHQNHHCSLASLLKQCKTMRQFKQIHSQAIRTGLATSPVIQRQLLSFSSSQTWTDMEYAQLLFDEIPNPDLSHWNALIDGYSSHNSPESAVTVYVSMISRGYKPDRDTFSFLLEGFTREAAIEFGDEIHAQLLKLGMGSDEILTSLLVVMYTLTAEIDDARQLFDRSPTRDVTIWNKLISGYCENNRFDESCKLFKDMIRENVMPDSATCISVVLACKKLKDLELGVQVHLHAEGKGMLPDLILENALIDMYTECGAIGAACKLFDGMTERNLASWSLLVVGLVKSGQIDHARQLFDQMPDRDALCYCTMIGAYVERRCFKEALEIFQAVQTGDLELGELTVVNVLTACAELGALETGEWVRCFLDRNNINVSNSIGNALIDMYVKCGTVGNAMWIFDKMHDRDKQTWNTIIVGLANNNHGENALDMFVKMLKSGERPDEVTFCSIFTACANAGMIDKGRELYISMIDSYGMMPNVNHYCCMVDLLCRAGRLKQAFETILNMPMRPNADTWGTFLDACKTFGSIEMGEFAAKNLMELNPDDITAYVLLSNLYAKCNRWEDQRRIREIVQKKGINKEPGCSFIEVKRVVHEFESGGGTHPLIEEIHSKLREINGKLKVFGYNSDGSEVFSEVFSVKKIFWHSEKVALAFGLLSSGPHATIRIVKNFRTCSDCHKAIKLLSKLYSREIVLRERNRVHHFRDGSCSCRDYW